MAGAADIAELSRAVRAKDYTAQLAARQAGAGALAALAPLLADPDEEVRQLAVHCLVEAGDPGAAADLARSALDPDEQVAMAAAKGLHLLGGAPVVPTLLGGVDQAREPLVRRELALVVGRWGGPNDVAALRAFRAREPSVEARQGALAALARLGDIDAREEFANALVAADGRGRKPWLDLAGYIGQRWLLGPLGSVLEDETPVLRVGVDARPDLIQALRACDLAVILIAEIGGAQFSFQVTRGKNYTPAEIDEVRRFVWSP